jgi:predicted outer membrane repeat protein
MPQIMIRGCTFEDNLATASGEFLFTVTEVLSSRVYNQRGGGLAFYFGTNNYSGVINIQDSRFTGNKARDSGGGIYAFLGGPYSAHNISISNTSFVRNSAQDGGGLEITHSNNNSIANPNFIRVTNCKFDGNSGKFGGGYKNIQLDGQTNANHLVVTGTVFKDNVADVGAGIYLQAVVTIIRFTLQRRVTMEDW